MCFKITSDHAAGHWTAKQLSSGYFEERSRAIGLAKDNKFIAGVIYENCNGRSITCHIAISGRMTTAYLAAIFDYPFNVCKIQKIIVPVDATNIKSIALVQKMGFAEEARVKDGMADGDLILFTLAKKDCKYLGERYGEKINTATTIA